MKLQLTFALVLFGLPLLAQTRLKPIVDGSEKAAPAEVKTFSPPEEMEREHIALVQAMGFAYILETTKAALVKDASLPSAKERNFGVLNAALRGLILLETRTLNELSEKHLIDNAEVTTATARIEGLKARLEALPIEFGYFI